MTPDRIKEIQDKTAFPDSVSVCQALLQVWNECEQDNKNKKYTEEDIRKAIEYGYQLRCNHKPINSGIDWVKEFKKQITWD
jgi:hypothetical protein